MTSLRIVVFQMVVFVLFIRLKLIFLRLRFVAVTLYTPETVLLNFEGAQESIPPSRCSLAGRYDNPIPVRFLAHIDC
jgi:hypothetical protein